MTQDRKIYQTIYTDESDEKPKQIEWTIEELRDRVINSESINSYYLKDKATHWKELFEDKLPSQQDLDGEKWRVVLSDEPSVTPFLYNTKPLYWAKPVVAFCVL